MTSIHALALAGLLLGGLAADPALAGDARAGRQKLTTCQGCHGLDGLSKNPEAPNLAGQVESYLVRSLEAYRSGDRKNESMNIVAKDLSDEDIADVAAYYASIQVDVLPP
ncbi:c-type cytochrome [Microvirga lotononidis]|uniref:Cytochrome c553 n=1 Tax=Microvirga lotononidis TaxID=864069 RepID=I4YUI0_9HYPH|nr:cytochrome c [Microvirga lotononidis]EIM27622.1 cytochrome c553 [Microvirga lotononidis]WQO28235.1 cytochrome c [Microvirga lotononidis]